MSNQSPGKVSWLVFFIGLVFSAAAISSDTLTQAQNKKAADQKAESKKPAQKLRVEDAIERVSQDTVRARSGFEIKQLSDTTFSVRRKTEEIGKLKCGACPGGNCRGSIFGGGARCRGCGGANNCFLDPF